MAAMRQLRINVSQCYITEPDRVETDWRRSGRRSADQHGNFHSETLTLDSLALQIRFAAQQQQQQQQH